MAQPFLDRDFPYNWQALKPECVESDIRTALDATMLQIEAIAAQPVESVTYASTLLALEEATEALGEAWGKVGHLDSVCNSPELRKAYNAMLPAVSDFYSSLYLNDALWRVIDAFAKSEEGRALTGTRQRFLEETLADFREAGAALPPEKKKRLAAINSELASQTQQFSENVLDSINAWELILDDDSRLAGLPESAQEAARESALKKGHGSEDAPKWRFTLHMPSFLPAVTYLEDRALRETLWRAAGEVGLAAPHDNTALVKQILALRDEKAQLLGFDHFADYTTRRRMAGSGQYALDFIEEMFAKVKPRFDKEVQELKDFAVAHGGPAPEVFEPWDAAFWCERQRQAQYDFDEEVLRPYFPINRVIDGLFTLAQKVFDVRITEREGVSVWHEEVKVYDMHNAEGRLMGTFYADWHPREPKRGGAWMNHFRTGGWNAEGQWQPHLGLICGNLTPATNKKPALLNHREVETIFHEFGHLIHHLAGEVEVRSLNGIHVVWDFVELPSQIMENWCWERESLDLFARHYETGEPIPQPLFDKMLAARNFQSAMGAMRQLSLGKLDLELHLNYAQHHERDLDELLRELLADYIIDFPTRPPSMVRRFTHLFGDATGYAAGYYSYKWAEVLDADAFTRFQKEGILNSEVGRAFRECILSKGNSAPAGELFRAFIGRDPDPDALLKRSGII